MPIIAMRMEIERTDAAARGERREIDEEDGVTLGIEQTVWPTTRQPVKLATRVDRLIRDDVDLTARDSAERLRTLTGEAIVAVLSPGWRDRLPVRAVRAAAAGVESAGRQGVSGWRHGSS
jgi:hypothetical protein